MSNIGNIYARYGEALQLGLNDFEASRQQSKEATQQLYPNFISNFIHDYSDLIADASERRAEVLRIFKEQFNEGRADVSFAAIDGTCGKEQLSEVMVFYAASYAQNGTLNLGNNVGRLSYTRWSPSEDTSFVAYLPIPLNALSELEDEDWLFRSDDDERSEAAMIHTSLMQLAEIYLAYKRVTSEDRPPKILLMDHSTSSILLSTDVMHLVRQYRPDRQTLGWIGAYIARWGRVFEPADGLVAHSHPMERNLRIPSLRSNALSTRLVAEITNFWQIGMPGESDAGLDIPIDGIELPGLARDEIRDRINVASKEFKAFSLENDLAGPNRLMGERTLRQRWYDLRLLFEDVCEGLFRGQRREALKLNYPDGGNRSGTKWMGDNDIRFLAGVGLRLLIEICWQKRVLLIGIVKDSNSRYFFKNFLSVMDAIQILDVPRNPKIMGTDRSILEMLPLIDGNLSAPWSTIEFDAIFMTLRALLDAETGQPRIQGVRGDVLAPSDGLIMRSLIQLFLLRRSNKDTPLMGHVLFMDRIAYPYFDSPHRYHACIETERSFGEDVSRGGSRIKPLMYLSNQESNIAQEISVVLTEFLTKNLFPEAIGQPDPLHRADQGAKALGKQIRSLVLASTDHFKRNPLAWSFRDIRDRRIR